MPHVLVADSDGISLQNLSSLLERERYRVSRVSDGRSVLRAVSSQTPDLVLLETVLSDQEGFEICRRIRRTSDVPIMFVSSRSCPEDRVQGLQIGADDFLSKPCAPAELLARVGAVLRRAERARRPPTTVVTRGAWTLDPLTQTVTVESGEEISITPREVHLLAFLMKRGGRVCTTEQIVQHVWGYAGRQARSIVATAVWRLRAKLEGEDHDPRHLITVRNLGYKYEP